MNRRNNQFKDQIGMSLGTATYRLLRKIVFRMAVDARRDVCYHCGLNIIEKDFSIEHKEPWLHISADLFWDLNNIAFSHKKCNSGAARQINKGQRRIVPPDGKSWCTVHKQFLSTEEFSKNRSIWNGLQRQCDNCRKKRNKRCSDIGSPGACQASGEGSTSLTSLQV